MTSITIYRSLKLNKTVGFCSKGHAGYADAGSDIVCSAISVLTINTINSVEQFTDDRFDVQVDEDGGMIDFRLISDYISEKAEVLMQAFELGIETIEKDYSGYLSITVMEV